MAKYVENISRLFLRLNTLFYRLVGDLELLFSPQLQIVLQVDVFCVLKWICAFIFTAVELYVVTELLRFECYLILAIFRHRIFLMLGFEDLDAVDRAFLFLYIGRLILLLPLESFQNGK